MSEPDRVVINDVEYQPVYSVTSSNLKIVVLDRGFVVVGNVSFQEDYVVIDQCSCIRKWGTTQGLGEIAFNGPTSQTKLDKQPRTTVHKLQVVQIIDCEASKWNL